MKTFQNCDANDGDNRAPLLSRAATYARTASASNEALHRCSICREGARYRGAVSRRLNARWFCASTRRARFRRWTNPRRCFRGTRDKSSGGRITLTLFAALDAATKKMIGRCYPRHRGRGFLSFLREIERNVPPNLDVRLIMDNYATHKTPAIQRMSPRRRDGVSTSRRPRVPGSIWSSASSPTSPKSISAAIYRSTADLAAIKRYVSKPSKSPQPKPKSHETQNQDTRLRCRRWG